MKNKEKTPRPLATRNAVETSIDMAKSDKESTWERLASKMPRRIRPWGSLADQTADTKYGEQLVE